METETLEPLSLVLVESLLNRLVGISLTPSSPHPASSTASASVPPHSSPSLSVRRRGVNQSINQSGVMERRLNTPARRLGTSRAGPMEGEAERRSLRRPEGTERGLFSVSDGDVPPDGGGGVPSARCCPAVVIRPHLSSSRPLFFHVSRPPSSLCICGFSFVLFPPDVSTQTSLFVFFLFVLAPSLSGPSGLKMSAAICLHSLTSRVQKEKKKAAGGLSPPEKSRKQIPSFMLS